MLRGCGPGAAGSAWARRPDVRIGAVIAVAALVALVVWLLVTRRRLRLGSGQPSAEADHANGGVARAHP